jgi:WS/DGAT/MGAT family acyltransferase
MRRLAGTDALFLSMETPSWHQHVGGLTILDPEGREVGFQRLLANVERRIPLAPKFRWKLQEVPFGLDRPVWVDDPDFDVRKHVRRIGVPSPGGARETAEVAGQLLGYQLDRRRPLWELWYLEGLANGRVAMVMKYHHCLLDGVAGASLATVLMDLEPEPDPAGIPPLPPPEEASAGPTPSELELFGRGLVPDLGLPVRLARYVGTSAARLGTMANFLRRDERSRTALMRAPRTPFNAAVGPNRALAFASVSLDDVRAVKQHHGVKVNDVVLALSAGALRHYLAGLGELPEDPLISGVPVSTRAEGDDAMDNQVSTMFVSLATDVADPVERLLAIHASSTSAKEMGEAVRARQIQSLGEVASPLILGTAIRAVYGAQLIARSPMRINTLVSNIPGPPVPLYTCGARVTGIYSSSVILEGMGVNITVLSYIDRLDFGVHVDPDLVPDPWAIAEGVPEALAELLEASGLGAPTAVEDPFGDTSGRVRSVS